MDSTAVVNFISSSLDSGNYKEALTALNKKRNERFSDYCYEVVAAVVGKIQDDTIIIKPSLHGACEQIIAAVIEKCTPEDALLEFIERVELAKNDAQFGIILPVLQQLLRKVENKKRSLEWCLSAISNYIEKIEIVESQLEEEERMLLDNDPNVIRVTKVYTMVISFYQPFVEDILAGKDLSLVKIKEILSEFLIGLLGKPMIFIDIDPNTSGRSEVRQCCQLIIMDICKLEKDVLKYLSNLEDREKNRIRYTDAKELSPFATNERMNMSTYAGFFYVAYSGHFDLPNWAIPQVYNNEYVVHTLMIAVTHLLKLNHYCTTAKSLALYQALNIRMSGNTLHETLSSPVHFSMCKELVNIAKWGAYQNLSRDAVEAISKHVKKFDYKGQCTLIKFLIETSNHSGIIGWTIHLYKDLFIQAFNEPELDECFKRTPLQAMLKRMCHLPQGAASDLTELGDQIITTLNFLRFLILKDKDNKTGIKEIMVSVQTEYFELLRTGIVISVAHYRQKLKCLKEEPELPSGLVNHPKVTILGAIPMERKVLLLESSINAFHLMEGLIARVNECLNNSMTAE